MLDPGGGRMEEKAVQSVETVSEQTQQAPEQKQQTQKRSPAGISIGLFLTWLCAWMLPELTLMLVMFRVGHGLSRWQYYLCAFPGLLLMAVLLNHTVYSSGVHNESVQTGNTWKEKLSQYFSFAGKGLPVAIGISVVFLVGRLLSQILLSSVRANLWIAPGIIVGEIILASVLLLLLVRIHCGGVLKGAVIKFLALLPVLLVAYAGMGILISLAQGLPLFTGKPMYRLCICMIAAAVDAVLVTPVLMWITRNPVNVSEQAEEGEKKASKSVLVAYGVSAAALLAVVIAGRVVLGSTQVLQRLTQEVERHYLYLWAYNGLDHFQSMLAEDDIIEADLLLWKSTLYSDSEAQRLRNQVIEMNLENDYLNLMLALTSDRPIYELENMLYATSKPAPDIAMALLRLYAGEEKLTDRQEALRKELLLYLAGKGSYLDNIEIPSLALEEAGTEKLQKKLESLADYDIDLSAWKYMAEIMKKSDRMTAQDKMSAIETYFSEYHDPDSVMCLFSEQYFLDLLYNMDWGDAASADRINGEYLKLAETYPKMLSLQYLAAQSLMRRTKDGYSTSLVERHVAAAERYLELYQQTYDTYRNDPAAYSDYQDMIHATQGINGLEDAVLEFDEAGLGNARYFVGTVCYKAGSYSAKYYDRALELLGDAKDFETRNLVVCTYFDMQDYKKCIAEIDKMLSGMELSQKQKGQLLYLRALADLPSDGMETSLKDAAALADLVEISEGDTLLELEWLLFAYNQMLACGGEDQSKLNPKNMGPRDFSEKEWEILSGNKYLSAFFNTCYGFQKRTSGVYHADNTAMLDENGNNLNGWLLGLQEADKLLEENPNLSTMWYVRGGIWHERGDNAQREQTERMETCYSNAVESLEKALNLDPENGKIWYVLASTYRDMAEDLSPADRLDNYEKAYSAVQKALYYMGEDASHATDPYGSVIHADYLLSECRNVLGKER